MLNSPIIKTSLSSLLILDKPELKHLVNLEMSVLGCLYVQQHKIFLDFGFLIFNFGPYDFIFLFSYTKVKS